MDYKKYSIDHMVAATEHIRDCERCRRVYGVGFDIAAVSTESPPNAPSQLPNARFDVRHHGSALVTPGDHLEEEVGLLGAHRQVMSSSMTNSL